MNEEAPIAPARLSQSDGQTPAASQSETVKAGLPDPTGEPAPVKTGAARPGVSREDCPCHRKKRRAGDEKTALQHRLARVEGQVRGIARMLDSDAYCTDILTQVAAAQAALNAFARELLDQHIRECVVTDVRNGDDAVIDDLVKAIHKLMK